MLTTPELHRVTLLVPAEAGDDPPSSWNWASLIDTPYPDLVEVEASEFVRAISEDDDWDRPSGFCGDHGKYDPAGDCPGCVAEARP